MGPEDKKEFVPAILRAHAACSWGEPSLSFCARMSSGPRRTSVTSGAWKRWVGIILGDDTGATLRGKKL